MYRYEFVWIYYNTYTQYALLYALLYEVFDTFLNIFN